MNRNLTRIALSTGLMISVLSASAQHFDLKILTRTSANPNPQHQNLGSSTVPATPAGFQHVIVTFAANQNVGSGSTGATGSSWLNSGQLYFRIPKSLSPAPVSTYTAGAFGDPAASSQIINLYGNGFGRRVGAATALDIAMGDQYLYPNGGADVNHVTLFDGPDIGTTDDGYMYFSISQFTGRTNIASYTAPQVAADTLLEFDVPSSWSCPTCMQLMTDAQPQPNVLTTASIATAPYISMSEWVSGTTAPITFATVQEVKVIQNNQPLPITLTSFTASKTNDSRVSLNWETANEQASAYFNVERSSDGSDFNTTVVRMNAAGNSADKLDYLSYDNAPLADNYYRLKCVNLDGKFTYSEVRRVSFGDKTTTAQVRVVPNPLVAGSVIEINADQDQDADYIVSDVAGKAVLTGKVNALKGTTTSPLNTTGLAAGTYYLTVKGQTINSVVKMTKVQ